MQFARRIEKIPPYLFVEISRKIAEKRARGEDVVTFAIGDPDIPGTRIGGGRQHHRPDRAFREGQRILRPCHRQPARRHRGRHGDDRGPGPGLERTGQGNRRTGTGHPGRA